MDFFKLATWQTHLIPDAADSLLEQITDARNSYATQRLLGNSQAAWTVKTELTKVLRQLKVELTGERKALMLRHRSVAKALQILDSPISWPAWPDTDGIGHEDLMDDLMRSHRSLFRDKLEHIKDDRRAMAW